MKSNKVIQIILNSDAFKSAKQLSTHLVTKFPSSTTLSPSKNSIAQHSKKVLQQILYEIDRYL
jgi:hypothetical protein